MQCDLCPQEAVTRYKNLDLCQECLEATEESEYQYEKFNTLKEMTL